MWGRGSFYVSATLAFQLITAAMVSTNDAERGVVP